jgi:hypothetical protein
MVWALFLIIGIIVTAVGLHAYEYYSSIQEYNFTQPPKLDSGVLQEKTPAVLEIGVLPWRPGPAPASPSWTVVTDDGTEMQVADWWPLTEKPVIANGEELAAEMELPKGLAEINDARPWWWLPGLSDVAVDYLAPGSFQGFQWIVAERHWIGCSAGTPVTVWLVHSRYRRFLPDSGVDPWSITVANNPWIGRVQYIEVRIKPGWCLGIPSHWGFAVRPEAGPLAVRPESAGVGIADQKMQMQIAGSAIWNASQHSLLSWCLSNTEFVPSHTELWTQLLEVISPSPNIDQ